MMRGGGIVADYSITLLGSDVSHNSTRRAVGGGITVGGEGGITLTNTTVDANSASGSGGGIYIQTRHRRHDRQPCRQQQLTDGNGGGIFTLYRRGLPDRAAARTATKSPRRRRLLISGSFGHKVLRWYAQLWWASWVALQSSNVNNNTAPLGGGIFVTEGSACLKAQQRRSGTPPAAASIPNQRQRFPHQRQHRQPQHQQF